VPALWLNRYWPKLIFLVGLASVAVIIATLVAIFRRPKTDFVVEGAVLDKQDAPPFWERLNAICSEVGATPPDQIVAGIDDNFFVTEQPVTVNGQQYRGKTLFVSLALLKQLHSTEAAAVLAHEMAHFSGQDTWYTKKITPLLQRYGAYLQALNGGIAIPVYKFMLCFRALFELSLGRLSRQREFRADRIAASTTSPGDLAAALLRIAAYSKFRQSVETELFKQEQALERANVAERVETGFREYAVAFASDPDIGGIQTAHPFDSHPPLAQRLGALEFLLDQDQIRALLESQVDGGWYRGIANGDALERQQWGKFEERFRHYHEASLAYRFIPETADEQAIVEKSFPPIVFEGDEGSLSIDFEKAWHGAWADEIRFREITHCEVSDSNVLKIQFQRDGKQSRSIKIKKFPKERRQEVLDTFQRYYGRFLAAVEYRKQSSPEPAAAGNAGG
jgi:Zn-dependent protease with chaperone function